MNVRMYRYIYRKISEEFFFGVICNRSHCNLSWKLDIRIIKSNYNMYTYETGSIPQGRSDRPENTGKA